MIEKQIRKQRERINRSMTISPQPTSAYAYNPIINPLPIERKNPNVMRML
jgi:hypothetical protein